LLVSGTPWLRACDELFGSGEHRNSAAKLLISAGKSSYSVRCQAGTVHVFLRDDRMRRKSFTTPPDMSVIERAAFLSLKVPADV
jgi:hypothetical protein